MGREVDVDYARWESIRDFDVRLSNGITLANPQYGDNTVSVGAGTQSKWLTLQSYPDWHLSVRTGYLYLQSAIPDVTFTPASPDSASHTLSAGVGLLCQGHGQFWGFISREGEKGILGRKALGIDLAYQAWLVESRTVTGNPNPTVNGTYQTTTHAGSMTMRINF